MRAELLALGFAAALGVSAAHAALYKWVDDRGVVQYSDKPPPNNKGSVELSKRGIVVKKLDPSLTPEQRKAKEAEEARLKAEKEEELAQRRADNALLQSFTSTQEIDMRRNRDLQALDAILANLRSQERTISNRLSEDRRRADSYRTRGKAPPEGVMSDVSRSEGELKLVRNEMQRREQEKTATRDKYEALKRRYVELQGQPTAAPPAPASAKK
jgi:chromosome segregation ATPase